MVEESVLPTLRSIAGGLPCRECRIYKIVGLGESAVEEMVGFGLSQRTDLEVGYCARPNEVDLRIIGTSETLAEVEPGILRAVGTCLVSSKGEMLEEWVVDFLRASGLTLALAESCTGGLLAHRITNVPGASEIFMRGFVTYSNAAKVGDLGVPSALIEEHGAVSEPVAIAMAEGALRRSGSDFALSITGIAGPGGGTPAKPTGTVFTALAGKETESLCRKHRFVRDRETFKQLATQAALDMLRQELLRKVRP